jgi:hypothetical protein
MADEHGDGESIKVFYAWQSDTPAKVGKNFVFEVLREALIKTGEELKLEEAERPEIDQDTKGVMGSPVIAETIFAKIREAAVVVCDVTLTGVTESGKRLINSNVAYELGYAHGQHGDGVLLKVMNTHYGPPDDLPFDLRHRRWPVQYQLSPDATKAERRQAREQLTNELTAILTTYFSAQRPAPTKFIPTPSTRNPATYWNQEDVLVHIEDRPGEGDIPLVYEHTQPMIYLRIWPDAPIAPLPASILNNFAQSSIEPLGGRTRGYNYLRNKFGVVTFASDNKSQIFSSTQVLRSGEIWGINMYLLRQVNGYDFRFIPTLAFEGGMAGSLNKYLEAASKNFGYPDKVWVECGLVNIENFRLALPERFVEKFSERIYEDIVVQDQVVPSDPDSLNEALLRIFGAPYEAAGMVRPVDS